MAGATFEDKLKELEKLVAEIEQGSDGLNKSIEKYAQAQRLVKELTEILKGAKESLNLEPEEESEELEEEEE